MNMIIFAFVYIVEGIIMWHYCTSLFLTKYTNSTTVIRLCATYTLLLLLSCYKIPELNIFSFLLLNFLFIKFTYEASFIASFFHSALLTALMILFEIVVLNLFPAINSGFYDSSYTILNLIIMSSFSKFLYFISIKLIIFYTKNCNKQIQLSKKEEVFLLLIPVFSLIILTPILFTISTIHLPFVLVALFTIASIVLLFFNLAIYYIYHYISNRNKEHSELKLQLQHNQDMTTYYQTLQQQDEEQKILIHDIKKHLQSLHILNANQKYDKASSYIDTILDSEALKPSVMICNHNFLNALLNRYVVIANEKNIDFHIDIRNHTLQFLSDEDLTGIVCNLLDNAFTAASMPDGYIEFSSIPVEDTTDISITLVNSCRSNPFTTNKNKLLTTNKDRSKHGFGLKSVKRIVEKNAGIMTIYYDEKTYTVHTVILLHLCNERPK